MSEEHEPQKSSDDKEPSARRAKKAAEERQTYFTLGMVFATLGLVLGITNKWIVGLPFLVMGVVFFVVGTELLEKDADADDGEDPDAAD